MMIHRSPRCVFLPAMLLGLLVAPVLADALPLVAHVETQPLLTQVDRLVEALDYLGNPLSAESKERLAKAKASKDDDEIRKLVQQALDPYCLLGVNINPESRVKVMQGPAAAKLMKNGWSQFLVKVDNEAGVTAPLKATSPQAEALHNARVIRTDRAGAPGASASAHVELRDRWMDMIMFEGRPLSPKLSGIELEYRIIQLYSRDSGKRSAVISFDVGQGTQDIGFRNDVTLTFQCADSVPVTFKVLDENGKATTAGFEIRDQAGRVYPSQAKRLAPDFAFHPQIYRHDGEVIELPAGKYNVQVTRGPEYRVQRLQIEVKPAEAGAGAGASSTPRGSTTPSGSSTPGGSTTPGGASTPGGATTPVAVAVPAQELKVQLKRWVDPAATGWWSGDHHIHAAGCAHYTSPTEGVHAPDMLRHCMGEDLKIGANLTWGPCFDYQKQFFTGKDDKVSTYPYLLRYDIEVSGFGSHQSGHICLLRLKNQIPPGGDSKNHWPTLGLNLYRWAKKQGAVVGPAHSGWGLALVNPQTKQPITDLPSYVVPPFDGIGANSYIADVTHTVEGPDGKQVPAVDFISTVDTPYVWELNIWYHTLNCGFRTRISGETDFPCIYGERVGLGRSYVKLDGKLDYDAWCEGIRQGRNYVSDGLSHIMDMKVTEKLTVEGRAPRSVELGVSGSELKLDKAGEVTVTAKVAALLGEKPNDAIRNTNYTQKPFWHLERARIGDTRKVPVELIVNGYPVAKQEFIADGTTRDISFDVKIDRSSWVAIRVLASSHTNPVWVMLDGKPVRASKRSAEWCLKSVEQCEKQKRRFIKADEIKDFEHCYSHAAKVYRQIIAESEVE
ncbi:MAG: CehA/McbA family metallohydrolase [Phycisphaeraceae bacterium]